MPKTTIFIGSSAAARAQAKLIVEELTSPGVAFLPWWDAFTAGRTLIEELDAIRKKTTAAVLLFSPDARAVIRKQEHRIPNLNVLFEYGYFSGHFAKGRVAILKYGDFYLPSDLGGTVYIHGRTTFERGQALKVIQRTRNEFGRWIEQL